MRLFEFIKWWWNKNDPFNRTIGCFLVLWALPCIILIAWFGNLAVQAIFIGLIAVIAGWGIYGLFYWLRGMYQEFMDEYPTEDVAIVRKLKGIPTPSRKKEIYYD